MPAEAGRGNEEGGKVHSTLVDYVSPRSAEPVVLLHKEKDLQQIQASASGWCPLGASQAPALSPSEQAVPAARRTCR